MTFSIVTEGRTTCGYLMQELEELFDKEQAQDFINNLQRFFWLFDISVATSSAILENYKHPHAQNKLVLKIWKPNSGRLRNFCFLNKRIAKSLGLELVEKRSRYDSMDEFDRFIMNIPKSWDAIFGLLAIEGIK